MIKRVFPVAVVALALSAGGAFAEPPMAVGLAPFVCAL